MGYLLLTCQKATTLVHKQDLFGLNRREKIMLRVHMSVCKFCANYQTQSNLIEIALQQHFHKINDEAGAELENKELKEKIILTLKTAE